MNAIIDAALQRSRVVLLGLAVILVAGLAAYIDIPKEAEPDVNIPFIYVSISHSGISPNDAERLLVRPMEKELKVIEGIKKMTATASEGHASILLEFEAGFDADGALDDVREKVDIAKVELPDDTDEPTVNEISTSGFPVLVATLSGGVPERTLFKMAEQLKDAIETIPTVLEAKIVGDREEVLEVIVEPIKLESYNISNEELIRAINLNNQLVAAGALDSGQGRFTVKVPGLFETARDVLDLPLKVSADGNGVVSLGDVTTIRRTFKDRTSFARLNGQPAVALEITKRSGTNIIENNIAVRQVIGLYTAGWPENVQVTFSQDKMKFTQTILSELQNNILSAVLLVMIVVVGALGLRSGLLVGVAIPGSFLLGILIITMLGLTMNMVVMFSLILAVGMLVDGAIVVTEFADRRMAEGANRVEAYGDASKRMAWPIIASTATTLAAFAPLLFWPGIVGEFMGFLPITLIATLTASLIMALIFVPTLGSYFGKANSLTPKTVARFNAMESGDINQIGGFIGLYVKVLKLFVKPAPMPLITAVGSVAMLVGAAWLYAAHGTGVIFFPNVDPDNARVLVHARGNMSVVERDSLVRRVEDRVLLIDGIRTVYTRTGASDQGTNDAADVIGTMYVEFFDWDQRRPAAEILTQIREDTANIPGVRVEAREPEEGPPTGKALRLELASPDPEALDVAVERINAAIQDIPGLIDYEDSRPIPGIEWRLSVDRNQAGRFGADVVSVGNVVKLVTNGIKVGDYRPDDADEEVDIIVRFPESSRTLAMLDELRILTANGLVPVSNFVSREAQQKTGSLERVAGTRVLRIESEVLPGVLPDDIVKEIKLALENVDIPPNVLISFKGQDEEQAAAADFLSKAFLVALFIMAIILVTQFNSFYHAFLILSAVILSTIGVILGLLLTGLPFSIVMTGVGIITLAGIVVNNNIILIDTYQILLRRGMDPYEAILRTGAQRMRPVLLTAITTIIGLMPMVTGVGINFITREVSVGAPSTQWWVLLATTVASGLAFATVLTLVITPSLLALGVKTNHVMKMTGGMFGRRGTPSAPGAPAE
ncbi:MAG: efflux RND transporter permease subunit [Proteobacteria bacterium]|nr:efflux RND transporter permease subunit [Pseudomonadota bacterium]MDA1059162.1 efflux RND transporter permease subunit [Pseudomonadota bacterium]